MPVNGGLSCGSTSSAAHGSRVRSATERAVNSTLSGYLWSADASDSLDLSTKGVTRRTKFTWYTRGGTPKVPLSKTITVH
jgi:hypothetical protein